MPGDPAAPLQGRAHDGVAHIVGNVEDRAELLRLLGAQPFIVDALKPVCVDVTLEHLHVVGVMGQHHDAAGRVHDVVVERLRKALPQFHRVFVEALALLPEIVRADDRGVAPGIAAAQPAAFHDRDVAHAVFGGHVVGCCEPMPAGTYDDGIILGLRLGRTPLLGPLAVAAKRVSHERGEGKFHRP